MIKPTLIIDPPEDPELERAFLYGFLAGVPSPYLPPEAVLDYLEDARPEVKAAFESGQNLADQNLQWNLDIQAGYYEGKAVHGDGADDVQGTITRALACSERATEKLLKKKETKCH
jgi:hypothetical protein